MNRIVRYSFILLCLMMPLCAAEFTRALWVTRWDYNTLQDIDAIMKNASDLGFNTVLFQVRGKGTVTFPSKIELQSEQFRDSDLDVLSEAIDSAHAHERWSTVPQGRAG